MRNHPGEQGKICWIWLASVRFSSLCIWHIGKLAAYYPSVLQFEIHLKFQLSRLAVSSNKCDTCFHAFLRHLMQAWCGCMHSEQCDPELNVKYLWDALSCDFSLPFFAVILRCVCAATQVADNFVSPLLDAVLLDYQRNVASAREPEVLSTMSVIVDKLDVSAFH